jgi:serine/threonine protein kinase/Tfp pilus assembly protein PilF
MDFVARESPAAAVAPAAARGGADRYVPKRFHARGGMGEIWLADDSDVGRQVALKKMLRGDNPEQVERFFVEARITGQLEHPGIVPVHELGTNAQGQPFYVMKFVHGRTLKKVVKEFHSPEAPSDVPREVQRLRLLGIFLNICQTVAYAHSRGVLHRDLKPENVMLGPYGETLVLDWGVAKVLGQPEVPAPTVTDLPPVQLSYSGVSVSTETMAGSIMGSPFYMAPEMAEGLTDQIDQKSDIYLLGATLYEILTGHTPRSGKNPIELLKIARTTVPPAPRTLVPDVPKPLEAICMKAMALRKDDRYPTATTLAEDLQRYLAGEPVSAYQETLWERAQRWLRRHQKAVVRSVAAAAVVAVAVIVAVKARDYQKQLEESQEAQAKSQREADELNKQNEARKDVAKFDGLADEARYYLASSGPAGEGSPYQDAARGETAGRAALAVTDAWGADLGGLPLPDKRDAVKKDVSDLLLLLAQQKAREGKGAEQPARETLALLDRAAAAGAASRGYHRLRAGAYAALGDGARADEEKRLAEDEQVPLTALDHFLNGEEARARYASGTDRPDQKGLEEAAKEYRAALKEDPDHYWSHFQLGRCYMNLGREAEAVAELGSCVTLRPAAPWGYSVRGLAYARNKQLADAEADLDQAAKFGPDLRLVRLNRGLVYSDQKRFDDAQKEFDAVLAPPDDQRLVEAYYYRALLWLQRGDQQKAMEDFNSALEAKKDLRPALRLRALLRLAEGDDEKGLADVNAYLAAGKPRDADSAAAHAEVGRFLRGSTAELTELAGGLSRGTNERLLKLAIDEFDQAYKKGDRSKELKDDFAAVLADYGAALEKLKRADEAVVTYTTGLQLAPDSVRLLIKRGRLYLLGLRQAAKARADFAAAVSVAPPPPEAQTTAWNSAQAEAHTWLGFIAALQNKPAEARREVQLALLHGSGDYLALHNVACIYAVLSEKEANRRKEYEELALDLLRQAVTLWNGGPGPDELELIKAEDAFPEALKERALEELKKKEPKKKP